MATVNPTYENRVGANDGSVLVYTYALVTANPDGAPFQRPEFADLTFQATGTFGGATVQAEGSNDGTNWFGLTKKGGTAAATVTAAGGFSVNENPAWVRPNLSVVGAGASIAVTITARRATPLRT